MLVWLPCYMLCTYVRVYICTVCIDQFYEIVPYVCIITVHTYSHSLSDTYHSTQINSVCHHMLWALSVFYPMRARVCVYLHVHVPLQHCWKALPSLLDSCLTWIFSATTVPASPTLAIPTPPWDRPRSTCQGGLCVPFIAGEAAVCVIVLSVVCVWGGGEVSIRCIHIE